MAKNVPEQKSVELENPPSKLIDLETLTTKLREIKSDSQLANIHPYHLRHDEVSALATQLSYAFTGPVFAEIFLIVGEEVIRRTRAGEDLRQPGLRNTSNPLYGTDILERNALRDALPSIAAYVDPKFGA
jgi:hypothetical protein